jgi:DNA-binding CsgD family transcriptional regulator
MKADLIGVVEAAYTEARDDVAWLRALADAAIPLVDVGLGSIVQMFQVDPRAGVAIIEELAIGQYGSKLLAIGRGARAEIGPRASPAYLSQITTLNEFCLSENLGADFVDRHFRAAGDTGDAKNAIGIVGTDPSGRGIAVGTLIPADWRMTPAFQRRWRHVVAHLATGIRLRSGSECLPDEAVLDAGGKLYDASGKATSRDAQVALRQAARAIDRARVRRSREPDGALEAWHALVAARWSLVDRFESDGRSFLIAKPNPPRPPPIGTLTLRERAVVALAALGRSNKLIAYELGLSAGAVGNYLARAQHKLGAGSRAALIRLWHAAAPDGR